MPSVLNNKKSKVLVVDPSGPVRTMMVDTVRQTLGFEHCEGKASIQDVLGHLEADAADWLIVGGMQADQPVNALHLLKIAVENADLRAVRMSLFLQPDELYVVPPAFELGLLSWHPKPFTKDTVGEEMKRLMANLEADGWLEPLTAARYLRNYLKEQKAHRSHYDLDRALLDFYPGNAQVMLQLAEPTFHLGKTDDAKKILSQIKLVDPGLGEKVDEVSRQLLGEAAPSPDKSGGDAYNALGVKTVVVIDPDEAVRKSVSEVLKSLGVEQIHGFADGESAWSHLDTNPEPDLIILEWRIPKLSGPMLVQRVRQKNFLAVPLVVLSSLLKPDDMPLAREIGLANIVQKPLNRGTFIPAIVWTMQQERQPTEQQALERKIRHLLRAKKVAEAEPLRNHMMNDPNVPHWRKKLVEGEFAYHNGDYIRARDAAGESLRLSGESIIVLNLLGKTFMRLKNHEASLKCFRKAQEMAPNNIERLCHIAEAQTELGQHAEAHATLGDAKSLDPDSKAVSEAKAKVAITKGDTEAAQALLGSVENLEGIVAYMNNKAVAYAKCGHLADAVSLYKRTVQSIPTDKPDFKAIVTYNLALSQAREGEYEAAIAKLEEVKNFGQTRVLRKAQSLRDRLKGSLAKGEEIKFDAKSQESGSTSPAAGAADDNSSDKPLIAAIDAKRGDTCCYLIFTNPEPADARVTSLLAKPPRFQRRKAIARSEAMGVERVVKESA